MSAVMRRVGCWKMTPIRLLLVRGSIILNAILVCYLFISWQFVTPVNKLKYYEEGASDMNQRHRHPLGENLGSVFEEEKTDLREPKGEAVEVKRDSKETEMKPDVDNPVLNNELPNENYLIAKPEEEKKPIDGIISKDPEPGKEVLKASGEREVEFQEPPRDVQERAGVSEAPVVVAPLTEEAPDPPLNSLERKMYPNLRDCHTRPIMQRYIQKGEYWILENYIPAALTFRCDESITYTTHADYTFLDNLDPLTSKWQGPVSIAVYSPGNDFQATVDTILYLRNCMAEGVKKYVTFHLFFHMNHVPKQIPTSDELLQRKTACDKDPPKWSNVTTYRQQKKLLYPVNVARNVARANSVTYFNFPSDIELYPSINVIPDFFKMLKKPDASNSTSQRVFVFPIFEVAGDQQAPETKAELQSMLKTSKAIPFHKYVCPKCHAQPKSLEWQKAKATSGLSVFYVGKRAPPYNKWEPIYIGTNNEPIYDERLSWEGKSDKMTQMYIMCVRDYEFHILDNAFLVHRPGIKRYVKEKARDLLAAKQTYVIKNKIFPEYRTLFGTRKDCII